jgi:hypothetical protein
MKNQEMKQQFAEDCLSLEDAIELLRGEDNQELVGLFERGLSLVNTAVLNFSSLSDEEVSRVSTMISLCDKLINYNEVQSNIINSASLKSLVDAIEKDFVDKRFLLDDTPKEKTTI